MTEQKRGWTPTECFDKVVEKLLSLDDELKAAHQGYEDRQTAYAWLRLGQAIRGDRVGDDVTEY